LNTYFLGSKFLYSLDLILYKSKFAMLLPSVASGKEGLRVLPRMTVVIVMSVLF
jgi:hypothetical protein